MANFLNQLTTEEAKRLSARQIELLQDLADVANGTAPSEQERNERIKAYVQKKTADLAGDAEYQKNMEDNFM